MWIERLRIRDLRCIAEADLKPSPGLNVVLGSNGAGKTSLLEAVAVAAAGRSFRTTRPDHMVGPGGGLQVVADVRSGDQCCRIGVGREANRWLARLDGVAVRGFAGIAERLAVEVFEPDSHEIVSGGSESRRRFLDWGVFHVEPSFGLHWSRYQRALKQRNTLLRSGTATHASVRPWDLEMASSGTLISQQREDFLSRYQPVLGQRMQVLAPDLGEPAMRFKRGWNTPDLLQALEESLERDRVMGHSSRGPHRSDWQLRFEQIGSREHWSRGQQKVAVFGLCTAMLEVYSQLRGEPAVACLDDVFSELDRLHQQRCLEALQHTGAQLWLTSTEASSALQSWTGPQQWFHVEHGRITAIATPTL